MAIVFFTLWIAFGVYCFMCIWVPEMRVLSWWRSEIKLGAWSHACLAWFFCSPLLIIYGVLSPRYFTLLYVTMLFSMLMMFFGFQVDKTLQKRND